MNPCFDETIQNFFEVKVFFKVDFYKASPIRRLMLALIVALKLNCSKFSIFPKLRKEVDIFAKDRA